MLVRNGAKTCVKIHESCTEKKILETGFMKSSSHSSTESGSIFELGVVALYQKS
jgi:hypothetical protein